MDHTDNHFGVAVEIRQSLGIIEPAQPCRDPSADVEERLNSFGVKSAKSGPDVLECFRRIYFLEVGGRPGSVGVAPHRVEPVRQPGGVQPEEGATKVIYQEVDGGLEFSVAPLCRVEIDPEAVNSLERFGGIQGNPEFQGLGLGATRASDDAQHRTRRAHYPQG